jgi:hypothetical protein
MGMNLMTHKNGGTLNHNTIIYPNFGYDPHDPQCWNLFAKIPEVMGSQASFLHSI